MCAFQVKRDASTAHFFRSTTACLELPPCPCRCRQSSLLFLPMGTTLSPGMGAWCCTLIEQNEPESHPRVVVSVPLGTVHACRPRISSACAKRVAGNVSQLGHAQLMLHLVCLVSFGNYCLCRFVRPRRVSSSSGYTCHSHLCQC